jgi:hypothetical protein
VKLRSDTRQLSSDHFEVGIRNRKTLKSVHRINTALSQDLHLDRDIRTDVIPRDLKANSAIIEGTSTANELTGENES